MGEFESAGKKVRYTDDATVRLAADLYQLVDKDYNGSPSIDSQRLDAILKSLYAGAPLDRDQWNALSDIERRYADKLQAWRDRGRDGQDPAVPNGPGRIAEALAILPASIRAQLREASYRSSTGAPNSKDREITPSHLLDSVLYDHGHAIQHAERLALPEVQRDPASRAFNHEHMIKHLRSAQDHAQRLGQHLEKHASVPKTFQQEREALKAMREGTNYPPPGLTEASIEDLSKDPPVCCDSCKMFVMGRCGGYYNLPVQPLWKCESWFLDPHWEGPQDEPEATIPLGQSVLFEAVRQLDKVREADPIVHADALIEHPATICVDFDGVVHRGPHGLPGLVEGEKVPGVDQGLKDLHQHYKVVILTARRDLNAVKVWLKKVGLAPYIAEITNVKPPAMAYIDDRAIHFTTWPLAIASADPTLSVITKTQTKPVRP